MSTTEQPDATSPDAVTAVSAEQRIADLEATVADLVARLERASEPRIERPAHATEPTGSRRNLLKLAAGAAAGGTALALATPASNAAAADGDPLRAGQEVTVGAGGSRLPTSLRYQSDEAPEIGTPPNNLPANIFTVHDEPEDPSGPLNTSSSPATLAGYAYRTVDYGIYGFSSSGSGAGLIGRGVVGVEAEGSRANLRVTPPAPADPPLAPPPLREGASYLLGDLLADADGTLWYCVETGAPGTWRKLAGTMTAGTFHPVTPFRAYDSRREVENGTGLGGPSETTVSVSTSYDVESYDVIASNVVPQAATAVAANVVAINADGGGFATVNPGGNLTVGAAALNWTDGQTIGNAGIFEISSARELTVLVRGDTNIDLTIDITGYWT